MLRFFSSLILLLALTSILVAQTDDSSSHNFLLDTVAIETSRMGLSSEQTGKFVTVLTRRDLDLLPGRSLDEWLRFLPGVEVQARGAFGTQADLTMRGGTFNQVLVLIDGMRVNDPLTGHFQSYLPISQPEVARIEILRGPASAQYGPDAVGGVINIISRTFSQNQEASSSDLHLSAQTGSHAFWNLETGGFYRGKKLRIGTGGRWQRSDGHPLSETNRADFLMGNASASLGWKLGKKWDVAVRGGYDQRRFDAQYFYTVSPLDESREETSRWWSQARLLRQGQNSSTRLDLSFLSSRDSFLFNPNFPANVHQTQFININLFHRQELTQRLSLGLGAQADRRSIVSNDRGNHQDLHGALYAMLYWEPVPDLHLTSSLRNDYDANYGYEFTPQLNLSYYQPGYTLRGGIGRAIRAADYTERFVSTGLVGPLTEGRNLGNPDLIAESSWNTEIGVDLRSETGFQWSYTVFNRRGRNLIDYLLTPYEQIPRQANLTPGATYLYASNLSSLNTLGVEMFLQWLQEFQQGRRLRFDLGYTYLTLNSDTTFASKYLSNTATHQVTSRVFWQSARWSVGLQGLWRERDPDQAEAIGATLTPSFSVWHAQGKVELWQDRIALTGQVFNLFDRQYSDLLGAQMPGRWWMIGLQLFPGEKLSALF